MPQLIFFCELSTEKLLTLFSDSSLIPWFQSQHAGISLAIVDLSPERAHLIRQLNQAGIPVTAWLLLPRDQGYWFNADNAHLVAKNYAAFIKWTVENDLQWEALGLDIEPDINLMDQLSSEPWLGLRHLLRKLFNTRRLHQAEMAYTALINQMHCDGFTVESYQIPIIVDERKADSTLFQRALGLLDLPVDREVLMLYSSLAPSLGSGLVASYAHAANAIALGSTGGGVVIEGKGELQAIAWPTLKCDLLLASHFSSRIYIFSLEGCIRQQMLPKFSTLNWQSEIVVPKRETLKVDVIRGMAQGIFWILSHLTWIVLAWIGLRVILHKKG